MSEEPDDLAALREETAHGDRLEHAAADESNSEFVETVRDELAAIESGDTQKTLSIWDGPIMAFVRALEEDQERMEEVGAALQASLDVPEPTDDITRSELLSLALRVGFREAASEEFAAVQEAVRRQATNSL